MAWPRSCSWWRWGSARPAGDARRAVINVGAVLLWAVGHTIGLPVGLALWRPEPLSVTDLVLPVLEVAAALLFGLAVRRAPRPRAPRAWLAALALLPVVLLTTILTVPGAIAAPDDTWLPAGGTVRPQAGGTTTLTYCAVRAASHAGWTSPSRLSQQPGQRLRYCMSTAVAGSKAIASPAAWAPGSLARMARCSCRCATS